MTTRAQGATHTVGHVADENGYRRPYGVILAEQARAELRVIHEQGPCVHRVIEVHRTLGADDIGSDNIAEYGRCLGCNVWVVRTTWLGRRGGECYETRTMNDLEIARLKECEDRYRRLDQ